MGKYTKHGLARGGPPCDSVDLSSSRVVHCRNTFYASDRSLAICYRRLACMCILVFALQLRAVVVKAKIGLGWRGGLPRYERYAELVLNHAEVAVSKLEIFTNCRSH
jgi:hypothetical protein